MSGCSCICSSFDADYEMELISLSHSAPDEECLCCECHEVIAPGERRLVECFAAYPDDEDIGARHVFYTCSDCESVCDTYLCERVYGKTWENLEEAIYDGRGEGFADSRLTKVTPAARAKIISIIEDAWEEVENGNDARTLAKFLRRDS